MYCTESDVGNSLQIQNVQVLNKKFKNMSKYEILIQLSVLNRVFICRIHGEPIQAEVVVVVVVVCLQ